MVDNVNEPSSLVGLAVDAGEERKMLEMLRESGQSTLLANATVDRVVAVLRRVEHLEATPATPTPSPVPQGTETARWKLARAIAAHARAVTQAGVPHDSDNGIGEYAAIIQRHEAPGFLVVVGECPQCGPVTMWDEDGCCVSCGHDVPQAHGAALASPPPAQGTPTREQRLEEALRLLLTDVQEYQRLNHLGGEQNHAQVMALSALTAPVGETPAPEHRCGVRGFAESGDVCPACAHFRRVGEKGGQ